MEYGDTYFPLFRSIINHRYMRDSQKFHFWVWCLLKATQTPYKQVVGNQTVNLEIGQFVFGRQAASRETGLSEQTIRTLLKFFSSSIEQKLTIKTTNKFSVITVNKFDIYIGKTKQANQLTNQRLTSNQPATNHKQEDKEDKEDNNKVKVKRFVPPSIDEVREYMKKIEYTGDPQKWFDFYSSKGWMIGKNKMIDWRAAVRTWKNNSSNPNGGGRSHDFEKRFLEGH